MKLFNRNNSNTSNVPADLQPYYNSQNSGWRRWVGPALRALLLFVVLALIVWFGIWLVGKWRDSRADNASNQTSTQRTEQSAENSPASKENKKQNSPAATDDKKTNNDRPTAGDGAPAPTNGGTSTPAAPSAPNPSAPAQPVLPTTGG